jgi:endonuclease-3
MTDKPAVEWDAIFERLDAWRASPASGEETVVTAMARDYKREPHGAKRSSLPWITLVSTILSLRTKDEVTREASARLLAKAPGPRELIALGEEETARLAYPAGFYRTKAANLRKIAEILLEKYGGEVPHTLEELLALPGVGRKTANLVLVEAFDEYGICVDTHVHRISNRAGWVETKEPDKTELRLREILPKQYWKRINSLLVRYGQVVCRPISPICSACVIKEYCARVGVGKSR